MSVPAVADHYDVIEFKLKGGCSLAIYLQVVKDFNEWGKGYGYRAEIAGKVQHPELTTLLARFAVCSTHPNRSGMDTD